MIFSRTLSKLLTERGCKSGGGEFIHIGTKRIYKKQDLMPVGKLDPSMVVPAISLSDLFRCAEEVWMGENEKIYDDLDLVQEPQAIIGGTIQYSYHEGGVVTYKYKNSSYHSHQILDMILNKQSQEEIEAYIISTLENKNDTRGEK